MPLRTIWIGACVVGVLIAAALGLPQLMKDRSCHNPLRDGRTHISPELNAHIRLEREDWPALVAVFEDFAESANWSFRDDSDRVPAPAVQLSVCSADGTEISAMHQIWPNTPNALLERGISIGIYQPQGGTSWEHPTQRLLLAIERRWPGKLGFTNERGEDVKAPAFLGRGMIEPSTPP